MSGLRSATLQYVSPSVDPSAGSLRVCHLLHSGFYHDHWICEYWSEKARWTRVDAQLDEVHCDHLSRKFDCADLKHDAFVSAGQAWKLARNGRVSPDAFGHGDAKGWWFLR